LISVAPLGPWFFPYLKGFPRKILGVIIFSHFISHFISITLTIYIFVLVRIFPNTKEVLLNQIIVVEEK